MWLAEGARVAKGCGLVIAWLFGFVVVLLLFQIFAPSVLDTFFENLGVSW